MIIIMTLWRTVFSLYYTDRMCSLYVYSWNTLAQHGGWPAVELIECVLSMTLIECVLSMTLIECVLSMTLIECVLSMEAFSSQACIECI